MKFLIYLIYHPYIIYFTFNPPTERYPDLHEATLLAMITTIVEAGLLWFLTIWFDNQYKFSAKNKFMERIYEIGGTISFLSVMASFLLLLFHGGVVNASDQTTNNYQPEPAYTLYNLNAKFTTKTSEEKIIYKNSLDASLQFINPHKKAADEKVTVKDTLTADQLNTLKCASKLKLQKDNTHVDADVTVTLKFSKNLKKEEDNQTYHIDKITLQNETTTTTWFNRTFKSTEKIVTVYATPIVSKEDNKTQKELEKLIK